MCKIWFSLFRNVTKSARIGSILNSVFKTLTVCGSSGSNHRAKSRGYFSANSLQTLSKLTVKSDFISNFNYNINWELSESGFSGFEDFQDVIDIFFVGCLGFFFCQNQDVQD
jgi:hypothetical protein